MALRSSEPGLTADGTEHPARRVSSVRAAVRGYGDIKQSWSGIGWQVLVLVPPTLAYFAVRDLSAGQESAAYANAASIVRLEKALGLDWEAAVQARVLDTDWIITLANWVYMWGHFPVMLAAMFALFRLSRTHYTSLRNALLVSGAIGLVCFALYPVAPPRLFDTGLFFDSVGELSYSYRFLQNPKLTNQFAAVPSFHVGWNLLVCIAVCRSTRRRSVRAITVVLPMAMIASVVVTANHWLLDIVAGAAVAAAGIAISAFIERRLTARQAGVSTFVTGAAVELSTATTATHQHA